jgi:hypothetical protein
MGKTFIIHTTNIPDFTGIDAGNVAFANGKATITNARMAAWFREHEGYSVEEVESTPASPFAGMKVDELKAYAVEHNIDLGNATKKEEIVAVISAASNTAANA